MRNNESDAGHDAALLRALKAIASPVRLSILHDLKDPTGNYPPQIDGNPTEHGICADFIRERGGIAAATASRHLGLLTDAGLLIATRRKGWTFYRRDEGGIAALARRLSAQL